MRSFLCTSQNAGYLYKGEAFPVTSFIHLYNFRPIELVIGCNSFVKLLPIPTLLLLDRWWLLHLHSFICSFLPCVRFFFSWALCRRSLFGQGVPFQIGLQLEFQLIILSHRILFSLYTFTPISFFFEECISHPIVLYTDGNYVVEIFSIPRIKKNLFTIRFGLLKVNLPGMIYICFIIYNHSVVTMLKQIICYRAIKFPNGVFDLY